MSGRSPIGPVDATKVAPLFQMSPNPIRAKLSWPGAAMAAVPVMLKPGAEPVAVFLVEALGTSIAPNFPEWDAAMTCMLEEVA